MLPLLLSVLSVFSTATVTGGSVIGPRAPEWTFTEVGNSGIVALEAIIVSPTLAVLFDRASNDPLQINNHSAWGALWNLETNEATALDVLTNSFCASGSLLSNGTMVSVQLVSVCSSRLLMLMYYRSAWEVILVALLETPLSIRETWASVSSSPAMTRQVQAAHFLKTLRPFI